MPNHAHNGDQAAAHPRTSYRESREAERKMFARRLWRLMVAKGWNQSELARRSGVGRDMISGYIRAKHLPDPPHAAKLAEALGVPAEDLFPMAAGPAEVYSSPAPVARIPRLEMRALDDGRIMLHVNLALPMDIGLQVLTLIQAHAAESDPREQG